ncbi:O-Antigen ligase [Flavobacterium columnare]|uniref:O-antigen ligase family protein n=2 Tax=Flavobacterium TaxID=237 RepID=A0ABW8PR23_9FLAO|nr:O-antigen ligase family protein [Flavobacterium columnare]SPE77681.1 O-Antigen ligase [Flavobacterium columnare]
MSSEDLSLENSNYNFSFESIFVVLTLSIYLLLDFAPVLNSIDVAGFQWLTMSILNVGIGYFVFHFIKSENLKELRTFKVNNIIILYSIFLFFSGISIFYAPNFSEAILTFNRLILIAFLVFTLKLFSQIKIFFLPNLSIAISIIAFFQSFIAFTSFISKVNEAPLNEIYNILTQNSGNINIFSATLVFKIPFILYGIHYFTGIKKVFFSLTFILVSIILFLTLSRTSIISLLIVSVCFIIASLVKKNNLINTFIVLIGLFIAFGFQTKYLKYLPKKGVIEVYMSDAESDATSGRIYLWKNTIEIIKNSPFLGTGLGSYKIESIPYESKQRTTWSISKYSHNDFLQTASETGIINGLIYLSLFLIIAWKSFKILIKKSTESDTSLNTYIELEKINPKKIIYTENIAVCYYQLKKYNFAIPYLKKVIDSKIFKNGKSEYIIAACYHYMKQSELACNYAQMALNNNYIPKDCKEIMIKNCTK